MAGKSDLEKITDSKENSNNSNVNEKILGISSKIVQLSNGKYIRYCKKVVNGKASYLTYYWEKIN